MCSDIQVDQVKSLTRQKKKELLEVSTQMASEALRVLGLAYVTFDKSEIDKIKFDIQRGKAQLVFIGLAGMIDPPRAEAKSAIALCKNAGIKVVMATGDHKITAVAIAKEIGILEKEAEALSGADLDGLSDEELDAIINEATVFARVSPTHKYRIVESLRRKGHIVAMTGDGVNDAPALKTAEIGVAMGVHPPKTNMISIVRNTIVITVWIVPVCFAPRRLTRAKIMTTTAATKGMLICGKMYEITYANPIAEIAA